MLERMPLWIRGRFGFVEKLAGKSGLAKFLLRIVGILILAAMLYYPVGMVLTHSIDDDVTLAVPANQQGSRAVAVAAQLIDRETETHPWVANDPWFMPGAALDNMPNFQQGVISALSRFAIEMSDQIGRTRGSSQVDEDLDKAAGLLKYAGDVWVFDLSVSIAPTAPSDKQYRAAMRSLISYNERLARGEAVFDARADNLEATIQRISADLGSASAVIDKHVDEHSGGIIDLRADDIYYRSKGRLYAYYMLLRELKVDFAGVIEEKGLGPVWDQMLLSMQKAATSQPLIVMNATPDSFWRPNHLTAQGFYLLRARTQLKEVANILLK